MSAQHTPGPWVVNVESPEWGERPMAVTAANRRGILNWNSFSKPSSEETRANARLIAEAPDLLEAAQALIEHWDTPSWKVVENTGELVNRLRAAAAKATGSTT